MACLHYRLLSNSILIILFLAFISCKPGDVQEKGFTQINYSNVQSLEAGDWIEIDGVRFTHVDRFEELDSLEYAIPSSAVVTDETSELKEPIPGITVAMLLGGRLQRLNREQSGSESDKNTYHILNPALIQVRGVLNFTRSDSTVATIKTSEGYPAEIRTISF
ncbi:MAG: hypothetical protein JJU46_10270 [Balneolaceae bacterium]|nr:hypothetical protein [Balneolaceae bacterium]